ncbi:MAG: LacI family DNA-binding transcriptional regulator [Dysgonomonas sp.]
MKNITIKDIAKELNISIATVSRAISGDKNIRQETKKLVLEAVDKYGYKRNPVAINLKSGRTNTIGVIVPEMKTPFFSSIIEGIQNVMYPRGVKVIIAQSDENTEREKENLLLMESFMVDGIIIGICHKDKNKNEFKRLIKKGLPLVFYDRIPNDIDVSKVIIDDYAKSFFLVEYLIRKGFKKIAHIVAPEYMQSSNIRFKGYRDALAKFKMPYDEQLVVKSLGMSFEDGVIATEQLIRKGIRVEAIFACTDTIAIGAMNYLQDNNIRVPDDIAVAGFSGTVLSKVVRPALTTVEQPLLKMGEMCADVLLEKINDSSIENRTVILDATIEYRASTEKR